MGEYSPLPELPDEGRGRDRRGVPPADPRRARPPGHALPGALYAGLILTDDGPALLECNARFGDPEAQVILARLATPLGSLLLAAAQGRLAGAAAGAGIRGRLLPASSDAAVGIVLAAAGYPDAPRAGDVIGGLSDDVFDGFVFHAGTSRDEAGTWRVRGGRVLTVVGRGRDLAAARTAAERAAQAISFAGLQRRHDIAADLPSGRATAAGLPRETAGASTGTGARA